MKKRNGASSIITGLVCGGLILMATAFLGGVTRGFKDWDYKQWFAEKVEEKVEDSVKFELQWATGKMVDGQQTFVLQDTLTLTPYGTDGWYHFYDFKINSNQAFRVKTTRTINGQELISYNTENFVFGNVSDSDKHNGSFMYWTGSASNVTWQNAVQDFGGGLYYTYLTR